MMPMRRASGKEALGARKVKSQKVPVVFDPQMAAGFIASLLIYGSLLLPARAPALHPEE